ncbi:MAG: hypothetical protein H0T46_22370 [Deltaproteobacteria bacterium]|nr:hypothetical protein [Deltaproteobacteria bacterium]
MPDPDDNDPHARRNAVLDVIAAVLLGLTTGLAAFGAFQSSLYGGNQATAYTEATNTLGEANRELLRGVQERSFDTVVWMEHLKAQNVEAAAPETAAAGTGVEAVVPAKDDEKDDGPEPTTDQLAAALADELTNVDDTTYAKKVDKLLATRRDLTSALKWADEEHEKRRAALKPPQRLELAKQLIQLAIDQSKVEEQQEALVEKLGLAEVTEEEIKAAFAKSPDALAQMQKLEQQYAGYDAQAEKVLDKLAKPLFFESPGYTKSQEQAYQTLVAKGRKQFLDGQEANEIGDKFTLATVFMTVGLFFIGLSPIMRRFQMKAAFLAMGTFVAAGSTIYMFMHPLA